MSMYAMLRNKPKPTTDDLDEYLKGNLCRCTGYRPILESMKTFCVGKTPAEKFPGKGGMEKTDGLQDVVTEAYNASINDEPVSVNRENIVNGGCCGGGKKKCCMENASDEGKETEDDNLINERFLPYDPSQEPIFPPELLLEKDKKPENLVFRGKHVTWYRPTSLDEVLEIKSKFPEAKLVNGNTEVGLEIKFKDRLYPVIIHSSHVKELREIVPENDGLKVGGCATLDDVEEACKRLVKTLPEYKHGVLLAMIEMMRWFAGKQVRNVASIGGNIMTGSPISDLNPILMAAKCRLEVASVSNKRVILMDDKFFTSYRKTCLRSDEVLLSIKVPFTERNEYFQAFKQAKRRDDDIAIVNAAFKVSLKGNVIEDATMCYGGLAHVTKMANKSMQSLRGKIVNENTLRATLGTICEEFDLPPNAPGGMVCYRRTLALSLFFKFYIFVAEKIGEPLEGLMRRTDGVTDKYHKGDIKTHQFYKLVGEPDVKRMVGKPIPHKSGELHTTGEAVYVDDMVKTADELDLVFVTSTKAHANILKIDADKALQIEGVVDFVSCKDLPKEKNHIGLPGVSQDEEIFASNTVHCYGQIIGAVLANDRETAKRAAKEVRIEYEELPAIVTIEQAIQQKSFYEDYNELQNGNPEEAFATCDHVIEGEMITGAQEHFYLETQACIVTPLNENDEFHVYSSTQAPSDLQEMVAKTLGIDYNRVVCKTKRIGGGFGGKETRSCFLAVPVAVAANKVWQHSS